MTFVGAVAERFVLRHPAPAQRHELPAFEPVNVSLHVYNFKIPFYPQGAVAVYCQFGFFDGVVFFSGIIFERPNKRKEVVAERASIRFFSAN